MVSGPIPFDWSRAVAVVDHDDLIASGYLIAPALAVTAAHAIEDRPVMVRRAHCDAASATAVTVCWRDDARDVALLRLALAEHGLDPVTIGVVDRFGEQELPFDMYGWPLWGATRRPGGRIDNGGRLVRGVIYPADTSADGLVVLQPGRAGAVRADGSSDWAGMSGAAVFSLDRLLAIQRHHLDPNIVDAVEATPLADLFDDEVAGAMLRGSGVILDSDWSRPSTGSSRSGRVEVHGPSLVPLLASTPFHVRIEGFDRLSWVVGGLGPSSTTVVAAPGLLHEIVLSITDAGHVGRRAELHVEGSREGVTAKVGSHAFEVGEPRETDLVVVFIMIVWLGRKARDSNYTLGEHIRLARLGLEKAHRLGVMLRRFPVLGATLDVLGSLADVESFMRMTIEWNDRRSGGSSIDELADLRDELKHLMYVIVTASNEIGARYGIEPTDEWSGETWDREMRRLGFADRDDFWSTIRPTMTTRPPTPGSFAWTVLEILLADGALDTNQHDFNLPSIAGQFVDVVNQLIQSGWVSMDYDTGQVTPTTVGRVRLAALLGRSVPTDT